MHVLHIREQDGRFIVEVDDPRRLKEASYIVEHEGQPVAVLTPLSHVPSNANTALETLTGDLKAQQREIEAFERLYPELLKNYKGKVVAIYKGHVVAVGETRQDVLKAVWDQFGPVPCYIERVGEAVPEKVRIPSGWVKER